MMFAIRLSIALLFVSSTNGFSTFQPRSFVSSRLASTTAEEIPFFATTEEPVADKQPDDSDEPTVYEKIGIKEEELGLGISAEQVLYWIGTREELEAKIAEDNPKFDKARVSEECSKLYMDAEVLNLMIKFNEKMSDPEYAKAYEDMKNANKNVLITYAGWLGTGLTLSYLNKNFLQPKLASGEWTLPWASPASTGGVEEIVSETLPSGDTSALESVFSDSAASASADSVQSVVDVVTSAAESVQSSVDVVTSAAGQ